MRGHSLDKLRRCGKAHGRLLVALCAVALLSSASMALGRRPAHPFDPFTFGNQRFCGLERKPLRDFGLSRLPPLREVPESGRALGNHGAVDIYGGWGRVMSRPEQFGYGFSEHNYTGTVPLDWTVTAQLWKVDRSGTPIAEIDHGRLFIGRLNAAHQPNIYLGPPPSRGFYRFDIQFSDPSGTVLGSYGAHFKLVRPFWRARLGLSRRRAHPGQRVLSRVENLGTETVYFGEDFGIQRREGGTWVHVPNPTQRGWFLWLGGAGPGSSGRCSSLQLPGDFPLGHYRLVKEVGAAPWPSGGHARHLVAPLEVVAR